MSEKHLGPVLCTYVGKSNFALKFYIDGGSLRDGVHVASGVYEMEAADLRRICDQLAREHRHRNMTGEMVADFIDGGAGGDRWVRMSRTVADWIRDKRPVVAIDGVIG